MSKKLTTEQFIEKARLVHGDKYDYSKTVYNKMKEKVCIICPEHGEFWQEAREHLRGRGCSKCGKRALCKNLEYYIPIFTALYGDKYDYSESIYYNSHTKIKIKCNNCGSVFYVTPDNHMHGHGCKYCKIGEYRRIACLEGEVWRDVIGFEGFYMVSNMGRVKSLSRPSNNGRYVYEEMILSPRAYGNQREYLSVALHANGKRKQTPIHRLVAEAFIPNPHNYKEINHKDENKGNNVALNLEWCSRSYNVNYGSRIEKQSQKLRKPVIALDDNGKEIQEFDSIKSAAEWAGVDNTNISHAIKSNGHSGGFKWKLKNE